MCVVSGNAKLGVALVLGIAVGYWWRGKKDEAASAPSPDKAPPK